MEFKESKGKYWPFPDVSTNNNTVQKQTLHSGAIGSLISQYNIEIFVCLRTGKMQKETKWSQLLEETEQPKTS